MKKIFYLLAIICLGSCVTKKSYQDMIRQRDNADVSVHNVKNQLEDCFKEVEALKARLAEARSSIDSKDIKLNSANNKNTDLKQQLDYLKKTNTNLLDRLSDLSVVSKAGAENIKKSLEALDDQNKYIKDLNHKIHSKDSVNLVLVTNLKRSLDDVNDQDVNVEVRKGVVYISISDKMLFTSGSSTINAQANGVLGKIAKVINDYRDFNVLVEGHTDNVPINTACVSDNWDLSAQRSISVVRALQNNYGVSPSRMTAGARSEFVPKADNNTTAGRDMNRRTDIIILPKLDEFFELLVPQGVKG